MLYSRLMKLERVPLRDDGTALIGAYDGARILGVVGYKTMGRVLRYKTDWVHPNYRGQGIYRLLWYTREAACEDAKHVTAFCTPMSLPMYLSHGFTAVRTTSTGITFVRRNSA